MTETGVTLLVIGIILLLNIISLVLVYTTDFGKDYIESLKATTSKGYFIFWNFWMLLTGVCFWIIQGVVKLAEIIRGK